MDIFITIIVCLIAGIGAGLGTGFAGMSAAVVITPMLITFLDIPSYEAIGIALASDVLASAVSAIAYGKKKNLDIRNGIIMMISVLVFTIIGSLISSLLPDGTLGGFSYILTLALGIKFIVKPVITTKETLEQKSKKAQVIQSILGGSVVGFICGFIGAGGGMMMLILLTMVLGYELKTAVGTSVFIMAFTALTGSISHFVINGLSNYFVLALCIVFTLMFALIAAKIANNKDGKVLNRIVGILLVTIAVTLLIVTYLL